MSDAGYGFGAIVIGVTADLASIEAAFFVTAFAMAVSGLVALFWMEETHPVFGSYDGATLVAEDVAADG